MPPLFFYEPHYIDIYAEKWSNLVKNLVKKEPVGKDPKDYVKYLETTWNATIIWRRDDSPVGFEFKTEQDKIMFILAWS